MSWNELEERSYKRARELLGARLQEAITDVLDTFGVHPDTPGVDIAEYVPVEAGVLKAWEDVTKDLLLSNRRAVRLRALRDLDASGDLEGCRDQAELLQAMGL